MAGVAVVAGFTALAVSASRPGDAAYPGANGHIAYAYGEGYAYGGGSIWSSNADGSLPVQLSNGGNDSSPAFSPNGSRIAFERENGIAVMNADGSGVSQLLEGSNSFSSETKFATEYETSEEPPRTIPVVRIHTTSGGWHAFHSPSFSPDGSQLAVEESIEEVKFTSICAVEAEGDEGCLEYGSENAFFDYEFECLTCISRIVTVNSANGARTGTVATAPEEDYVSEPAYSADGKIAYARRGSPASGIYVVGSSGGAPTQVASGYNVSAPDFSPDGARIAFSHGGEIAIVGVGGGPVTILPTPIPSDAYSDSNGDPVFSPDGTKLSFDRTIFFKEKWDYGVYTMGTDGSAITKVIDKGFRPSWQPLPLPPPPSTPAKARARKGKVRLDKRGRAAIGSITCGSSPCSLKVLSAKLKAGKKRCSVKASLQKGLAAGQSVKVRVRIRGRCLAALEKAGKGSLIVKVRVNDALGQRVLTLKSIVLPKRQARLGKK